MRLWLLMTLLITAMLFGPAAEKIQAVSIRLWLDPDLLPTDILGIDKPMHGIHSIPQKLTTVVLLSPALPKSVRDDEETEQAAATLVHKPNALGSMLSYERLSIEGDAGNIFGLSGTYEREQWEGVTLGGILTYKYCDLNLDGSDFSSHLIENILYGAYLLLEEPLSISFGANIQAGYTLMSDDFFDDFSNLGGGSFFKIGKNFDFLEVTGGFSYNYAAMDVDLDQDFAHIITYGAIIGIPIGQQLAASCYVTETRNISNYDTDLADPHYLTLGTEGTWHLAGSWVLSLSYKTILCLDDYHSHEIYLGTNRKF